MHEVSALPHATDVVIQATGGSALEHVSLRVIVLWPDAHAGRSVMASAFNGFALSRLEAAMKPQFSKLNARCQHPADCCQMGRLMRPMQFMEHSWINADSFA